jgi:hypothetical protein
VTFLLTFFIDVPPLNIPIRASRNDRDNWQIVLKRKMNIKLQPIRFIAVNKIYKLSLK